MNVNAGQNSADVAVDIIVSVSGHCGTVKY